MIMQTGSQPEHQGSLSYSPHMLSQHKQAAVARHLRARLEFAASRLLYSSLAITHQTFVAPCCVCP
jgi:hypothetical protein